MSKIGAIKIPLDGDFVEAVQSLHVRKALEDAEVITSFAGQDRVTGRPELWFIVRERDTTIEPVPLPSPPRMSGGDVDFAREMRGGWSSGSGSFSLQALMFVGLIIAAAVVGFLVGTASL